MEFADLDSDSSDARNFRIIFLALFAILLVVHLALIRYTFPQADDFCVGAQLKSGIGIYAIIFELWSGRIASNFIVLIPHLLSSHFGFDYLPTYRIILLLNFVLFLIASNIFISQILQGKSPLVRYLLAAAFALLLLLNFYSRTTGFYWLPGAAGYIFGVLPFALILDWAKKTFTAERIGLMRRMLIFPLVILTSFMHELYAIAVVLLFASLLFASFLRRQRQFPSVTVACGLIVALCCFLANAMDSGSVDRLDKLAVFNLSQMPKSIGLALFATFTILGEILSLSVLCWFALVLLLKNSQVGLTSGNRISERYFWLALCAMLPVGLMFGFLVTGVPLPARALNLLQLLFIAGSTGFISTFSDGHFKERVLKEFPRVKAIVTIVLLASLIFDRGIPILIRDYFVEGKRFSTGMQQRMELLSNSTGNVVVPEIREDTRLLRFSNQEYNKNGFNNRCLASYIGVDSVRLASPR